MNLNNNPTIEELRTYISQFNDQTHSHALWVDVKGEVNCHIYPSSETQQELSDKNEPADHNEWMDQPNVQFILESFGCGMDYMGSNAAQDEEWVSILFRTLTENWRKKSRGYIGNFEPAQ